MRSKGMFVFGQFTITIAALLGGGLLALASIPEIEAAAQIISDVFIRLLRLVSVPIIFLSLVVTVSKIGDSGEAGQLLKRIVKYTILTTLVAASVALLVYKMINPVMEVIEATGPLPGSFDSNYTQHLLSIIPVNWVQPFLEGNVLGVLFLALVLSFAMTKLEPESRHLLHSFFDACFKAVMVITGWVVRLLPVAVFGFSYLFVRDLRNGPQLESIGFYLLAVIGANVVQGFIVLPLLLKWKGISPIKTAAGMWPALSLAFFSKSSASTIPIAIKCAEEKLGVASSVACFSFPLCTTINMNACAGFILITVFFISQSNGIVFTPIDMLLWVFIATVAAIGNAGVPMGCYFLTGALLTTMNIPLTLLGVILPFYTIIDMLETAINVWSDSCVTVITDREASEYRSRALSET